jgi:hypothetical protein
MAHRNLETLGQARLAVANASAVYVQPRFGVSEHWVKITKADARALLATFDPKTTPRQAEMQCNNFGMITPDHTVYLG